MVARTRPDGARQHWRRNERAKRPVDPADLEQREVANPAREVASGRIDQPTPDDVFFRRVMDITGDPLPYGVEPNRQMLEAIIRQSLEQGIITRAVTIEELFPEI